MIRIMLTINLKITVASALASPHHHNHSGIAIVHDSRLSVRHSLWIFFWCQGLAPWPFAVSSWTLPTDAQTWDGQDGQRWSKPTRPLDFGKGDENPWTPILLPWNQTAMNLICSPDEATLLFLPVIWGFVGIWPFAKNSWHQFCTSGW